MSGEKAAANEVIASRLPAAVPWGVAQATGIFPARAENAEIWDLEDRHYIDFAAGIAVLNAGHCHPRVLVAARKQMEAMGGFQCILLQRDRGLPVQSGPDAPIQGVYRAASDDRKDGEAVGW
ncbi:MAG: aminotransferase class III-fold pyridoxal phosphate-dependent enzyme [Steroidobacteraceae bacterium]